MSEAPVGSVTVAVPATSANLGPGFDVLGLAVNLRNQAAVQVVGPGQPGGAPRITIEGDGADRLARDARNLVYRGVALLFERAGQPVPALRLHLRNDIPVGRGLGSSAAAIVGGLVASNTLLSQRFSRPELLRIALELEPHPDNVAAALYGGLTIAVTCAGELPIVRCVQPAPGLAVALLIPQGASSTTHARGILPQQVSRADAVFNMGRATLLVQALVTGDWDVLCTAMEDRLHQPQRGALFPVLVPALAAARQAGAYGAALSGSGSTILAFASPDQAPAVADALLGVARQHGLTARTVITDVADQGAVVLNNQG